MKDDIKVLNNPNDTQITVKKDKWYGFWTQLRLESENIMNEFLQECNAELQMPEGTVLSRWVWKKDVENSPGIVVEVYYIEDNKIKLYKTQNIDWIIQE